MRGTEPPLLPCCADATGEYSPVETTAPNARVPAVCDTPRVAVAQDTVNQSPGDDRQRTRRRRLADAIIGHPATRRLALAHAVDDFSDSMINLSLLGSLFFSVSLEASQGRILTYLLLTAAPLAIAAPAIGPLLDRWRAGYRSTILGSQAVRAVLSVAVAGSLQSLAFYPLVFGILLSRKAYALAKTAIVADLVPDRNDLVTASGHLARTGTVAGGIGTAIAGLLILLIGVEWLPVVGAGSYLVAAVVSSTLPVHRVEGRPAAVIVRAETPLDVKLATLAVALIRAAAGALTFLLAFAIKRGGGDEWIYASALVVAGGGSFVGTMVAPRLHRALASDRIVALTLLGPAVVTAFGVLTVGNFSIIAIAFAIGLGSSISSRAMDGFYGRVPLLVRGRAISFSELVFQLANVTGAACAVLASPSQRLGFAVVALMLIVGGAVYSSRVRLSLRLEAGSLLLGRPRVDESAHLSKTLLDEAVHHAEQGNHQLAIAIADAAVRVAADAGLLGPTPATSDSWDALRPSIDDVVLRDAEASAGLAVAVIATARAVVQDHVPPSAT